MSLPALPLFLFEEARWDVKTRVHDQVFSLFEAGRGPDVNVTIFRTVLSAALRTVAMTTAAEACERQAMTEAFTVVKRETERRVVPSRSGNEVMTLRAIEGAAEMLATASTARFTCDAIDLLVMAMASDFHAQTLTALAWTALDALSRGDVEHPWLLPEVFELANRLMQPEPPKVRPPGWRPIS